MHARVDGKRVASVVCMTLVCGMSAWSQSAPATAALQITAAPMHSETPQQLFPRVKGLADVAVQERVNKVLGKREREDATARRDCLRSENASIKDLDAYNEQIRVRYLSPRFLSIEVRESDATCGAYPNANIPTPITLDLKAGREVDWGRFFLPGFLPPAIGGHSRLGRLYVKRSGLRADDECRAVVETSSYVIWLDSAKQALMVEPDLPHVVRVCAKTEAIPFVEIAPFVADKSVRLASAE